MARERGTVLFVDDLPRQIDKPFSAGLQGRGYHIETRTYLDVREGEVPRYDLAVMCLPADVGENRGIVMQAAESLRRAQPNKPVVGFSTGTFSRSYGDVVDRTFHADSEDYEEILTALIEMLK